LCCPIPQKTGERTGLCFVTGVHAYHNLALLGSKQNVTEGEDVANRFFAGLPLQARAPRCAARIACRGETRRRTCLDRGLTLPSTALSQFAATGAVRRLLSIVCSMEPPLIQPRGQGGAYVPGTGKQVLEWLHVTRPNQQYQQTAAHALDLTQLAAARATDRAAGAGAQVAGVAAAPLPPQGLVEAYALVAFCSKGQHGMPPLRVASWDRRTVTALCCRSHIRTSHLQGGKLPAAAQHLATCGLGAPNPPVRPQGFGAMGVPPTRGRLSKVDGPLG
jgi:hypothetical protein